MGQSVDEFFAQVNGTQTALVQICTLLLATSPHRVQLLELLKARLGELISDAGDTAPEAAYKQGVRDVMEYFAKGVEVASLAQEVSNAKATGGVQ
ncbi:hypothetical protein [Lysobacter sp. Root667]|uniref:hypothetical protein n=1 Tax=Lysobacter sp. Root667 TaxID=1736581 RepID=UPI000B115B24|nr:hypothetical protein [Lysobacter sp. Root667]